jgi:hypothetical protein
MVIHTEQVEAVKDRAAAGLMRMPGIVGVGVTAENDRAAVLVLVGRLTPEVAAAVPRQIEGHPVVIQEVGEIRTR